MKMPGAKLKVVALCAACMGFLGAEEQGAAPDLLMSQLADPEFKVRQKAQGALAEWGRANLEAGIEKFYQAYLGAEDPEVKLRSRDLLRELVILKQAGEGKGYLGIQMLEEEILMNGGGVRYAVRITSIMPGTPAERADLRADDLIFGIDDQEFQGAGVLEGFGEYVQSKKPRTDVTLHLQRNGQPMDVVVNLMRRPPDIPEAGLFWGGEQYIPPPQAEVEEEEFRKWLQGRREAEAKTR